MEMAELVLAPVPRRLRAARGSFPVPEGLGEALAAYTLGAPAPAGVVARIDRGQVGNAQGYQLAVRPEGISLLAADPAGLYYGVATLRQLLRQAGRQGPAGPAGQPGRTVRMPCVHIEDWPSYPVRGIMLDVSRDRVPTMATLRRLLDLWAGLKYNQLQLYTEHTFAYAAHPEVWGEASPLTPAEVEQLDAWCRERGVELVPNQNSFGHMERWLRHPRYRDLADATEGFPDPWGGWRTQATTLNPLDPASIELLSGLYDELLPHFSSRQLNVGADEPIDLGHGRSREACRRQGVGRVYLDFLRKLHAEVTRRGRVMQCWADVLVRYPELAREVPRDLLAIDWGYEADHPFAAECRVFAEAGVSFYVCPGTSSWNSLGGRRANARANIRAAARDGLAAGACGILLSDWGDNGHWQQLPVSYPAWVYGAAAGWNPGSEEGLDVEGFLSAQVFLDPSGTMARALALLGEAGESVALPNATVLAVLLLLDLQPYHRQALERFRGCRFEREEALLEESLRLLGQARPAADDGQLVGRELELTAGLLRHAVRLGRERFATPGLSTREIALPRRRSLAEELDGLEAGYRRLWPARSRPGGLEDSAGRMRALKGSYADPG
jgi:hexosaminidase